MRAVVYDAYGSPPELRHVEEPACPRDGVLVAVEATGVCRSDWHAWRGHDPVPVPMVPGHEWAGRISAIGPEVDGWEVGDRVTAPFVLGCGRCATCARGDSQVCPNQAQPGFTFDGSWAEVVAVPAAEANLVHLPDQLSAEAAASLGCRLATAHRAVVDRGGIRTGDVVAVHGAGGVGLSAVMVAAALGASVVVVDPSPAARDRALRLGAREAVDPHAYDGPDGTARYLRDMAEIDVSLDAVGHPATAAGSVRCLRPGGKHVQVGLLLGQAAYAIPMDVVVSREIQVLGSHGMPSRSYPDLLELVTRGAIEPAALIARTTGLEDGPAELTAMDVASESGGIVVLVP
ncbi:alcohol dehydrogenase catalytic domain-containing protein [Nocardioidaceae bacterium]|nr:alcohol dehydrogenase catalytic domain-containing protein [Nocardioidaceae bacterium]